MFNTDDKIQWTLENNYKGFSLVHIQDLIFSTNKFILIVYGSITLYNCTVDSPFVEMYLKRSENRPQDIHAVGSPVHSNSGYSNAKFIKSTFEGNESSFANTCQGKSILLH